MIIYKSNCRTVLFTRLINGRNLISDALKRYFLYLIKTISCLEFNFSRHFLGTFCIGSIDADLKICKIYILSALILRDVALR